MAFSQADLNAIAAAQAAHPSLPQGYLAGVAQIETGKSANPDTAASGTGPVGLFQIAPSTYQNPGFGLPSHPVNREEAIAALQDPNVSASFAADYLDALQTNKGSLDAATQFYSGGSYGQANVLAASSQFPGAAGASGFGDNPVSGATSPAAGAAGSGSSGGGSPKGSILTASYWWEVLTRMSVFLLGMLLLLVALLALLWQSKTVKVNVGALAAAA